MGSESKEARSRQKDYWKIQLDKRIAGLTEKGISPDHISKDAAVRKIRAEIRKVGGRLRVIVSKEKKIADMAEMKKNKAAASEEKKQKTKKGKEETPETSKRQQKKKAKKTQKSAKKAEE